MALTKITGEGVGDVDSLTVGTTSSGEFNALTISQANNTSGNESRIRFKRTTDAGSDREVAAIVADRLGGNDTDLVFETNTDGSDGAVEKMRLSHLGILSIDQLFGLSDTDTGIALGANGADIMQFYTGNSERGRFDASGNLKVEDGDLVIGTSGHGISFAATSDTSATGASMANELFDDYEEGTWTPTLGGNTSYTAQAGRYTKIGRYVLADFDLTVNVLGTGSAGTLQGLPFNAENSGGVFSGHVSFYSGLSANVTSLDCYVISNTDDILFTGHGSASSSIGNNLSIFQNSTRVLGTVHYFAA